jgi:formylglycine-generating enzyme required for sulfatase activity
MKPSAARAARPRAARTAKQAPSARRGREAVLRLALPAAPAGGASPAAYGLTKGGAGGAPPGMAWVPGGELTMGSDAPDASRAEGPAHRARVAGPWTDETDVTNAQFRAFVGATGYVTTAERPQGLHPRHRHVARRLSLRPGRGDADQGGVTGVRPRSSG